MRFLLLIIITLLIFFFPKPAYAAHFGGSLGPGFFIVIAGFFAFVNTIVSVVFIGFARLVKNVIEESTGKSLGILAAGVLCVFAFLYLIMIANQHAWFLLFLHFIGVNTLSFAFIVYLIKKHKLSFTKGLLLMPLVSLVFFILLIVFFFNILSMPS